VVRVVALVAWVATFGACTTAIGEDFQGYVGRPTVCNPVEPQSASPRRFIECAAEQTCILGTSADGSNDPANQNASCLPIHDSLPQASPCTFDNDCGSGAFCSPDLGCIRYCTFGGSDCGDGVPCEEFSPSATIGGTEFGFCAPPCDPSNQPACSGTCSFFIATRPFTACVIRPGRSALGAPCAQDPDCTRGLACDNAAQRCTRYCRVDSNDCGNKPCLTDAEAPLLYGGATYGVCGL
jgi:hypothetical protein